MLVALLMAYFLGGGGTSGAILTEANVKQLAKSVESTVSEPARADAALGHVAELKKTVKGFEGRFGKSAKDLSKLYKDHSAGSKAMLSVIEDLNADWAAAQERAIDLRFELKESLTQEEWSALFDVN